MLLLASYQLSGHPSMGPDIGPGEVIVLLIVYAEGM